jgi:PAS domain-containing protein
MPDKTEKSLALDPEFFDLLTRSYARLVGSPLVPEATGPEWLYNDAPFAVLAHNTDADPRFVYANRAAQACFEYSWDEFTQLPSRLSAEALNRFDRQRLLDKVAENGFVAGYNALRISRSGRRFWIQNSVVWQLMNDIGITFGQAAVFDSWRDT